MRAIETLIEEHRKIELVLDTLLRAIDAADYSAADRALAFLDGFADRAHQKKEELVLFQAMLRDSIEWAMGPVQHLHKEHDLARAHLRAARRELDEVCAGAKHRAPKLAGEAMAYATLMRAHFHKEEKLIFPVAAQTLAVQNEAQLLRQYAEIDAEENVPLPEVETPPIDARTLGAESTSVFDSVIDARTGGVLFDDGRHQVLRLHDFGHGLAVHANQYLIIHANQGMILDPGGPKVYPDVFSETMLRLDGGELRYIFLSHQDPDVGTALNAWLMDTDAEAYVSRLWVRFLPHFGVDGLLENRLKSIPDQGLKLDLAGAELTLIPAHFLHSPGTFQVYDPIAKILFTGDLGASLASESGQVENFESHIPNMREFHRRYMASRRAAQVWAQRIQDLDIEVIAPQHGPIFRGKKMVKKFIHWCAEEPCGVDLL